jgi:hypothetical protein
LAPAEEVFSDFKEDGTIPHRTEESIQALCSVIEEFNGKDKIISKGLWEKLKSVMYAKNIHDLEALNRIFMKQFTTFSNVNCNKFPETCLKEMRHV